MTDVSALSRLKSLRVLDLSGLPGLSEASLSGLRRCGRLEALTLSLPLNVSSLAWCASPALKVLTLQGALSGGEVSGLEPCKKLEVLSVACWCVPSLNSIAQCKSLKRLEWKRSALLSVGIQGLASCMGLQEVSLEGNEGLLDIIPLCRCRGLKKLNVAVTGMTDESVSRALSALFFPSLENLSLEGNVGVSLSSTESREALASLTSLKVLNLASTGVCESGLGAVLPQLTALNELTISCNRHIATLRATCASSALRKLVAAKCALTDDGIVACAGGTTAACLEELDVGGNLCLSRTAAVASFPRLIELDLSSTKIGDDELSRLSGCPMLRVLSLKRSHVTDLAPLVQCPKLEVVDASETPVDDWCVRHLLRSRSLHTLNISKTKVLHLFPPNDDEDEEDSETAPFTSPLRQLDLSFTAASDQAIGALAIAVPQLEVLSLKGCHSVSCLLPLSSGGCERLRVLDLSECSSLKKVATQGLERLPALSQLFINSSPVADIGVLGGCCSLTELHARRTRVTDDGLLGLELSPTLRTADLRESPFLKDVSALAACRTLQMLQVDLDKVTLPPPNRE